MLYFYISGEEERYLFLIGMIYETIVIIFVLMFLTLILLKYCEKRHKFTFYLLLIFTFYTLAVLFSLISKISIVMKLDLKIDPYSPLGWIFFRILSFRVTEFLVCMAIFLSYLLKVKVFHEGFKKIQRNIVIVYGSFTAFFDLVIYLPENSFQAVLLDAIAFLLTFIFMSMIYLAFMYRSIEAYRGLEEPIYRKAFLSLTIMAISFMLILLNFLLDRVMILILNIPGFTIFYYLGWVFVIIGILCAYLGYIRPGAGQLK